MPESKTQLLHSSTNTSLPRYPGPDTGGEAGKGGQKGGGGGTESSGSNKILIPPFKNLQPQGRRGGVGPGRRARGRDGRGGTREQCGIGSLFNLELWVGWAREAGKGGADGGAQPQQLV